MDKSHKGFTLVELMVVILIISVLAVTITHTMRGAIRQAHATKCMAHMRNLHTAVMAYVADKERYPYAASWELREKYVANRGEEAQKHYYERRGWVTWVNDDDDGKDTMWKTNSTSSHANAYEYPKPTDSKMLKAISRGSLFKYVGNDYSTYVCPSHKAKDIHLSYAMNSFFRWGDGEVAGVHPTKLISDDGPERWLNPDGLKDYRYRTLGVDSSRMALFVEIDGANSSSSDKRMGKNGDEYGWAHCKKSDGDPVYAIRIPDFYTDDCVWDWTDDYRSGWPQVCHEVGGFNHYKGGRFCHVVYLDGHVGAIKQGTTEDETRAIFADLHNPKKKD